MNFDAPYTQQCRDRIAETAQSMLKGERSYIEGSRLICDLLDRARLDRLEEPFDAFVVIESETDAVPVGERREGWHPEAKIKLAPEWLRAENYAETVGDPACREAIKWLAANPFYGR